MLKIWILSSLLFLSPLINASEQCNKIKERIKLNQVLDDQEITLLNKTIYDFNQNSLVKEEQYCELNLIGKMMYKGFYFEQDIDTATKIFHHLSEKGYPKGQFNFALAMTKNKEANTEEVATFLLGIYTANLSDNNTSHLSKKARILLDNYLEGSANQSVKYKTKIAMSKVNVNFFNEIRTKGAIYNNKVNNIRTILAIGTLVYSLSAPSFSSSGASNIPSGCGGFMKCGFEWNPMNLPQIQ